MTIPKLRVALSVAALQLSPFAIRPTSAQVLREQERPPITRVAATPTTPNIPTNIQSCAMQEPNLVRSLRAYIDKDANLANAFKNYDNSVSQNILGVLQVNSPTSNTETPIDTNAVDQAIVNIATTAEKSSNQSI